MKKELGKAYILGDNIDTDQILPGYAMSYSFDELAGVALAGSQYPDFADTVQEGDVIFGGDNFGCGSSREQAPLALKSAGVGAIIAKSFARIFRRNAINIGLLVLTSPEMDAIIADAEPGDQYEIDLNNFTLRSINKNKNYKLDALSDNNFDIIKAGGLIERVRERLHEENADAKR